MYQGIAGDAPNSIYPHHHHQFNQPPFQNPNPNNPPIIDSYLNPSLSYSASAPPLSSSFSPSPPPPPDFSNYSIPPVYPPPYPHNSDFAINSTPTAPSFPPNPNPNIQFPNYSYDLPQNQPPYYVYDQNHSNQAGANPNLSPTNSFSGPQYSSYEDGNRWGDYGEQDNSVYEGAYRYDGGKVEPYGARGTAGFSGTNSQVMFDDYGRPINVSNGNDSGVRNGVDQGGRKAVPKMVKAAPKVDVEEDVRSGVQKFRVKVLAESYGQNDLDVLCEIGLDGIRMLDPATSRTLRIYPLDTMTRWEVLDSYIFAFWARMPVDNEPKRIRLKSNSYTTNTILDTVTAASVQLKEIGERNDPNASKATAEQLAERKKGFVDWMNLIKPPNEEKDHWVPDEAVNTCTSCATNFNAFNRKHHCRNCGEIFCDKCTQGRTPLTADDEALPVRVCDRCMAEVTQRLDDAREAANRSGSLLSHGDLAKKLKEEMSRNSKSSAGSKPEGHQTQMREVACPICTVHLQVEVPASGSETIECSVCQHPFLVNAN